MIVIGEHVARWVMAKVGSYTEGMTAIGWERDGVIVAGTSFESFNQNNGFGHQRIDSPATREYWFAVADYIFRQCKLKRFTALVEIDNEKAIKLNKRIGFEVEATLKQAGKNGDLLVMVLWADKCRMRDWNRK